MYLGKKIPSIKKYIYGKFALAKSLINQYNNFCCMNMLE